MQRSSRPTRDAGGAHTIVLVIGSLQAGGAERQLCQMANYWATNGLDVTLVTSSGPETPDFYQLVPRVERVYLSIGVGDRRPTASLWRGLLTLRRHISAREPDAVLSFLTRSNIITLLAAVGLGKRIVVSERVHPSMDDALPRMWWRMRKLLYRRAFRVVAQTRDAAIWIQEQCHSAVAVVPNALRCLPTIHRDREQLVVGIGRLTNQKGFDLLLRAFARLADSFEAWSVAIVGSGPAEAELRRLSEEVGISGRVQFVGETKAVEEWMARAGIIVQPSRFEGFPNVVMEGMGMGAAVISSDCQSGPSDLIADGVNGVLVPVDDVDTLAQRMSELMAQRPLREQLGSEARKISERYNQEAVMRQWEVQLFDLRDDDERSAGLEREHRT